MPPSASTATDRSLPSGAQGWFGPRAVILAGPWRGLSTPLPSESLGFDSRDVAGVRSRPVAVRTFRSVEAREGSVVDEQPAEPFVLLG